MTRELEGRSLTRIAKPPGERLARLDFGEERALVIELMGRSSNLLLLDGEGRILRYARTHKGEFRRPVEGDLYVPPPASSKWGALDLARADPDRFHRIVADTPKDEPLEHRLLENMPGLSVHLAREVGFRARGGEDPSAVFDELSERVARGAPSPILYSPRVPAELSESFPLTPRNTFSFVFPLDCAAELIGTPMPDLNAAERAASDCLLRHMTFQSVCQSLSSLLNRNRRRAIDLARVLRTELAEAVAGGEQDRRQAELILAGLRDATRQGGIVRVVDHYDPRGRITEIPIDPRLDLKENAQRYFRSARRRERTREMLPDRIEALGRRIDALTAAQRRVERAGSRAELETVERELQDEGLVKAFRGSQRPEIGRRPEYVQVREFRTRDGFTVLVGKTAAENDQLTFKVASAHDLWLHAAGYPGAHVIVRNPRRLGGLPETTVREAAGIAAYFSKARSEKMLDVHVAWRRHVRKGRGMSPGMVMLKKHKTVRVAPALPPARPGGD